MFIAGVVIGPALAITAGDFLFHSSRVSARWRRFAVGLIMLVIVVVPFLSAELKAGLLIGFPLGLLLAATPIAFRPDEHSESPTSSP